MVQTTDYIDGFVGKGGSLSFLPIPEGRLNNNAGTLKPEYIINDQQGNARFSFEERNNLGLTIVRQENSYYPFGLIMPNSPVATGANTNKNLYNGGSEWQNDYGDLPDLYQTFYRNYNAALGRWTAVDPKAELTDELNPYHYACNNPVMLNDPLGDAVHMDEWGHMNLPDHGVGPRSNAKYQDGDGWHESWINKTDDLMGTSYYYDPMKFSVAKSMADRSISVAMHVYENGQLYVEYLSGGASYITKQFETESGICWMAG